MRTIAIFVLMLGMALAQTLEVPAQVRAGTPVPIKAAGLEPGAYPIDIEGPDGVKVITLVTTENNGVLNWVPKKPGKYRIKLYLTADKNLTAELRVVAPPPQVSLSAEGLEIGDKLWPLPEADWLEPLVTTDTVYLAAQGEPIVLAYPLDSGKNVAAYYPTGPVAGLLPGPVVIYPDGSQSRLNDISRDLPYEGEWHSLDFLKNINDFWRQNYGQRLPAEPDGYRPYWLYWAYDPAGLSANDLKAWGRDLLNRGHRPELAWGEGARFWTDAWQEAARRQAGGKLTWALLQYAPLHPGSKRFFRDRVTALEVSGHQAEALQLQAAMRQTASFSPTVTAAGAKKAFWALVLAYAALFLVIFFRYLPSQRRSLADWGGLLGSWSRNPLRRLRYLLLAYATWGERLLALLIFMAVLLSFLFWSFAANFEKAAAQPMLDRATLSGPQTLANWPSSPGLDALKAYRLAGDDPEHARRLLESKDPPLAFAQLLDYRLTGNEEKLLKAYRLESAYVPVQEELGLGADAWTRVYEDAGVDRRGVPRLRDLCRVYFWGSLAGLAANPTAPLQALGVKDAVWGYVILVVLALWALVHLWVMLLPRPRGAERSHGWLAHLVELLVPGSNSFGKGWGVVLLLMAAYGAVLVYLGQLAVGAALLVAAYLVHLFLWFEEVKS